MTSDAKEQILSDLERLPPEKQRRAAELVRSLLTPLPPGATIDDLMKVAGTLDDESARQMLEAIEEGCGRVDMDLPLSLEERLALFDEGTERQKHRERLIRSMEDLSVKVGEKTWTREDLYDRQERYEVIDGVPHEIPAPTFEHQDVLLRLAIEFRLAIRDRSVVAIAPLDVVLDESTSLQPDLVFVREANRGIVRDVVRGVPDLVVEVLSASTWRVDRELKSSLYARYGVEEYWIVDRQERRVERYRLDREAGEYRLEVSCEPGDRLRTPLIPALHVAVADLFG